MELGFFVLVQRLVSLSNISICCQFFALFSRCRMVTQDKRQEQLSKHFTVLTILTDELLSIGVVKRRVEKDLIR